MFEDVIYVLKYYDVDYHVSKENVNIGGSRILFKQKKAISTYGNRHVYGDDWDWMYTAVPYNAKYETKSFLGLLRYCVSNADSLSFEH